MSGLLAGKVWLSGLDGHLKPLAATLADIANDDGTSIYPSVAYMAWRLGASDRSVQRWLSQLLQSGVLQVVANEGGGRGLAREYRLIEKKLPNRPPWTASQKDDNLASFPEKGDICDAKGCQPEQKRVTPVSPETSLNVCEAGERTAADPLEPWKAIGLEMAAGTPDFQECWKFFFQIRQGAPLGEAMERCIQQRQRQRRSVPPAFYEAKRKIEDREAGEVVAATALPEIARLGSYE